MNILDDLISEAYTLFSSYKFGRNFAVCTYCCLEKKHQRNLLTMQLKELPEYTIYQYLDAACDANDVHLINQMRYLLPRVLELFIQGKYLRHSTEITLDKLYCKNSVWRKEEIAFLERFAKHYFEYQICHSKTDIELHEIIIMFHTAGLNVTDKLLNLLLENANKHSVLTEIVNILNYHSKNSRFTQVFADHTVSTDISNWLQSKQVKETFTQTILKAMDCDANDKGTYMYDIAFDMLTTL